MALFHAYTQTVADGTNTAVVRPSDWNSGHLHAVTLSGNTAGASTVSGTNIVYQGGNNVTLSAAQGAGVGTVVVSIPNFAGTGFSGTNISGTVDSNGVALSLAPESCNVVMMDMQTADGGATAGATYSASSGSVFLRAGNNMTLSQTSNTIVMSGLDFRWNLLGNTAGTTSSNLSANSLYLSGGNNVTLSGNSNTIVVSAAAGGAGPTFPFYEPNPLGNNTSASSFGQNRLYFLPIKPMGNISMTAINVLMSMNMSSSTISLSKAYVVSYGLYSLGTGTQSTAMYLMGSSSLGFSASNSSNANIGFTIGQGTQSASMSSAASTMASSFTGIKNIKLPFNTTIPAGYEYYIGYANSIVTNKAADASALMISNVVLTNITNASIAQFSPSGLTASSASVQLNYNGFMLSATSGAWPSTMDVSQRSIASNMRHYMYFDA